MGEKYIGKIVLNSPALDRMPFKMNTIVTSGPM